LLIIQQIQLARELKGTQFDERFGLIAVVIRVDVDAARQNHEHVRFALTGGGHFSSIVISRFDAIAVRSASGDC
jgi:hypothetical protein